MTNYVITKYSENYGYCLECICGTNFKNAQEELTKRQAKMPDAKLRIETVENKNCWWKQGYLD